MKLKFSLLLLITLTINNTLVSKIKKTDLAGSWYPSNKIELKKNLDYYFSLANKYFNINDSDNNNIKAIITPHAGYYFSGLCASSAYQAIKNSSLERIIIIGPSHNPIFNGIALPDYDSYITPLGKIPVDKNAISELLNSSSLFKIATNIHQKEHSIEIQLPFLQYCLDNFSIIPLIVGKLQEKDFEIIAQKLNKLLNNKTLIIISSDFIHYGKRFGYTPNFSDIEKFDNMAIKAICNKSFKNFDSTIKTTKATICGKNAIKILLKLIKLGALGEVESQLTSYYNSAQIQKCYKNKKIDVSKLSHTIPAKSAVSYASIIFKSKLTPQEKQALLKLARNAITKKLFPNKNLTNNFTITNNLKKPSGAFVTLRIKTKNGNKLRGCIGTITSNNPLYKTIPEMAKSSAFNDPRFLPLTKKELNNIIISITVLKQPHLVKNYHDIIIGKHGIILEKTINGVKKSAVFLPQVAVEQNWDLETTLNHLSQKAGLKKEAWKHGCKFKVFEGFKFQESFT